jgi:hypothetical protein
VLVAIDGKVAGAFAVSDLVCVLVAIENTDSNVCNLYIVRCNYVSIGNGKDSLIVCLLKLVFWF